uniref:Uncharacterized protein n=1 Tax=Panagrolaimus sp. PS1159 TaxID=55785 RepID=A0AC35G237_9BILA
MRVFFCVENKNKMDRARKKLASAIDGIRNLHTKIELDVEEKIAPEHCFLSKVSRLILSLFEHYGRQHKT